jgi:hypothetical protein
MSRTIIVTVHPGVGPGEYTAQLKGGNAHVRAGSQIVGTEQSVLNFHHDDKLLDALHGQYLDVRDYAKAYALQLVHKHLRDRA